MALKIYSAVQTEVVTTTELKEHIRLDSTTISSNVTINQCIVGGYHSITAGLTGTAFDVLGNRTLVVLESYLNSASATVDCKIQESDDNVTYTDWTGGGFTQVTTANDTSVQQIEYTGTKQYVNTYVTVAGAEANFAVNVHEMTPYSSEDTYLGYLIKAAREYAEDATGRAIGSQKWTLILDKFPGTDFIEVPKPPLSSVTSLTYIDDDGTTSTMTTGSSGYYVDTDSEPGRVFLADGVTWPDDELFPYGGVKVLYACGHSTDDVPLNTRQAILMYAGLLYKFRDTAIPGPDMVTIDRMLYKDKVYTL